MDGRMDMGRSKFQHWARLGCTAAVLALGATAGWSFDSDGFVSFGVGNKSCDQYVADAKEPERGFVYETWLSGYLTAFNAYRPGSSDILAGTDLDEAVVWIKAYCRDHPALVVHMAAVKFIHFMQQKENTDGKHW
jgi:hypothetical protein